MKVSIIIVNFNTSGLTETCINSINFFEKEIEKEIIIVDNNSDDNSKKTLKLLSENHKNIKCIFLDSNKGYAYANNRGVEICSGDFVLILNPDIVFTRNVLRELIEYLKEEDIGAVGVKLYGEDEKFQKKYYCKYPKILQYILFYSIFSKPFLNSHKLIEKYIEADIKENCSELQKVPQIPGAFIFMKRCVYNELNGFNESYFLFFEDVDLCYRIAKNYKLYIADSGVVHIGASSMMMDTNYKIYGYFIISFINFFRQNSSTSKYYLIKSLVFVNSYLKIFLENIKRVFNKCRPDIIRVHKFILDNYNSQR
ncbi:MAG: glycosyltransferase [Ignavibacteria bacterium]